MLNFLELVFVEICVSGVNGSKVRVYIEVIGIEKLDEKRRDLERELF